MLPEQLTEFLDQEGRNFLSSYNDFDGQLPEGWTIDEKCVDHYGGEGEGERYWTVWRFRNGETQILIRFNGYYESYNGAEYTNYEEVIPKEKTIIVYESTH